MKSLWFHEGSSKHKKVNGHVTTIITGYQLHLSVDFMMQIILKYLLINKKHE